MSDEEQIIENLKDAGCDSGFIENFIKISETEFQKQLRMLEKHREKLLESYHEDIKKLECLDYLIYNIRKANLK